MWKKKKSIEVLLSNSNWWNLISHVCMYTNVYRFQYGQCQMHLLEETWIYQHSCLNLWPLHGRTNCLYTIKSTKNKWIPGVLWISSSSKSYTIAWFGLRFCFNNFNSFVISKVTFSRLTCIFESFVRTEMAQLVCAGCHTLLMYVGGATSVQCSCCHTVNLALEGEITTGITLEFYSAQLLEPFSLCREAKLYIVYTHFLKCSSFKEPAKILGELSAARCLINADNEEPIAICFVL